MAAKLMFYSIAIRSGAVLSAGGSTAVILGLSWGGVDAPWSSVKVLVSLIIGTVGLVTFFAFEFTVSKNPLVQTFIQ